MPQWKWSGRNRQGETLKGEIEAASAIEAEKKLKVQGIRAKTITGASVFETDLSQWLIDQGLARPFLTTELCLFTRQFSTMIESAIPIISSLEILTKSQKNPRLKKTLKEITEEVRNGKTLWESLTKQAGFSKLFCNLVRAGELAGILDKILLRLANHLENQEKLKKKVKSALTYPIFILVIGILIIWGLMVFVVPMFLDILKDSKQEIPWVTQFIVNISNFLKTNSLYLFISFFSIGLFFFFWKKQPENKKKLDYFLIKFPLIGPIVVKSEMASFTKTLSALLNAGVPLIEGLEIGIETLGNSTIQKDLEFVRKQVIGGKTFGDPLLQFDYFPDMVIQMIKVGEKSGTLDTMLERVGQTFEEELEELIGNTTKMLEPAIIFVLGVSVAFVLIGMYLPVFLSAGAQM